MNKILKKTIEYIPVAVVCTTVSVFAAIGYVDSKQVSYCPDTTNMEATTVSDAIDVLYENVDYTPVGTVSAFMGTTVPNKYLLCNGATYNISDYPKLAEHIKKDFGSYNKFGGNGTTTFAVPDLRGEFLRGAGTAGRNSGTGAAVGTHQDGTIFQNWYSTGTSGNIEIWNDAGSYSIQNEDKRLSNSTVWQILNASRSTGRDTRPNKSTARPTNTAVNYIIKAK